MANPTTTVESGLRGGAAAISTAARTALERLPAAHAISVMEDMLRAASDNNNNNNNNNDNSNGGSGCAAGAGFNRQQLLERLRASTLSDDQLHAVLKQQGII